MKYRRITFFALFCLFLFSVSPVLTSAQEVVTNNDQTKYVEMTRNTNIYDNDQKLVGEFNVGVQIGAESIQDGNVYFKWDGVTAHVNEGDTKQIGVESLTFTPFDATTDEVGQTQDKILTQDKVEVYSDSNFNTVILTLNPQEEYFVTKSEKDYYSIVIGKRAGFIKVSGSIAVISQTDNSAEIKTVTAYSAAALTATTNVTASTAGSTSTSTNIITDPPVKAPQFSPSDRYFQVMENNVSIYDNSSGSLKFVGYLNKGQVFPRLSGFGEWQQIKYGNGYGYVWMDSTIPANGNSLKDLNPGLSNANRSFIPTEVLTVYDNSTGSLVPYASLAKGVPYPYISDGGDWLQVDIAGRIGYVYKPATTQTFLSSDRYFEVKEENVSVYDNSSGSLKLVGHLKKGEVYPRVGDIGDWHQIKFGNGFGYVWKASTIPGDGSNVKNMNTNLQNTAITIKANEDFSVYDNSTGTLIPFGTINKDTIYPVINEMGDWYQVDLSSRIGYIYKLATTRLFSQSDKYFQVKENNVPIYDNSSGSLVVVGYLNSGEIFPRVSDMGDWHQIKFGNKFGYVWKAATTVADNSTLRNENKSTINSNKITFKALQNLTVYDNTSGSLVPFGTINKDNVYQAITILGDWLQIDLSGRIGYVLKDAVETLGGVIFLDPGHGGTDPGAVAGGYREADLNLSVAKKVQALLVNRGYTVYMSRTSDTTVDLLERSKMANNLNPDIFVSIHTNSSGSETTSANGIEGYYYAYDPAYPSKINAGMDTNPDRIAKSMTLANLIHENLVDYTGSNDRGTDGETFSVLRESAMPATLVEMGFINNPTERQKLVTDAYQNLIAVAIADGIDGYFKIY